MLVGMVVFSALHLKTAVFLATRHVVFGRPRIDRHQNRNVFDYQVVLVHIFLYFCVSSASLCRKSKLLWYCCMMVDYALGFHTFANRVPGRYVFIASYELFEVDADSFSGDGA